jgi:hypothetical protein
MDDTTWINHKQQQLESILTVADDFYTLNNIQVNKTKSVLITNAIKDGSPVTLQFGTDSIVIKPCKPNESTRVLGVWINIKLKHQFVKAQVKDEITKACRLMKFKRLTDQHLLYIFNKVVCPNIAYKLQLTVLGKTVCEKLNAPFHTLFKNKSYLSSHFPNYLMEVADIYKATSLYDLQLQNLTTGLQKQLNSTKMLGLITEIRWR